MGSTTTNDYAYASADGARVAYQITGQGPAVVLIKNNRRPSTFSAVDVLAERFRVLQIHPIGFGASERPSRYPFGDIGPQVLAVLDQEGIDRFVVWGFSQTGSMAAMAARSTDRAVALVAGGVRLIGFPDDTTMRRLEREPRLPLPPLEFWRAYRRFDWHHELKIMTQPKLVYIGTQDPAWPKVRQSLPVLKGCGCDFLEFADLDHTSAGLAAHPFDAKITANAIIDWIDDKFPQAW